MAASAGPSFSAVSANSGRKASSPRSCAVSSKAFIAKHSFLMLSLQLDFGIPLVDG